MTKIYDLSQKLKGELSEEEFEEVQGKKIMVTRLKSLLSLAESGHLTSLLVVADTVRYNAEKNIQELFVNGEYVRNPTLAFAALQFGASELFLGALNKPVPPQIPLI